MVIVAKSAAHWMRASHAHFPINAVRPAHVRHALVAVPACTAPIARNVSTLGRSTSIIGGGLAFTAIFREATNWMGVFHRDQDDSWSGHFRSSWQTLTREVGNELQDDNRKVIAGLIVANVAVCGLWRMSFRSRKLERFMWQHFSCSYEGVVNGKRIHTLLTSAFSHITLPHLAINMFMLWEFGTHILAPSDAANSWLNKALSRSSFVDYLRSSLSNAAMPELLSLDQFTKLYAASALMSSLTSIIASRVRGAPRTPTIGASGAVMGIMTVYCLLFPDRRMMLYGIFELTATEMLQLMTAINIVGSAFQSGLRIDFVGHLGGQACGLLLHEGPQALS